MTYAKALLEYKKTSYKGAVCTKELEDDYGVQFRKKAGINTFATSYFYRSQNCTLIEFNRLTNHMAERGFELTSTGNIDFEGQLWPKTSWARIEYTVRKI